MISTYWLEKRKNHWTRLESLLEQSQKQGLGTLTRSELREMGLLYRQAAADLSSLREDPSGSYYARSLNLLLARAHNTIYSGQKARGFEILRFYGTTYPMIFRRNLPWIGTSLGIFVVGAIAGALLTLTQPNFMHLFLGPSMMDSIEHHKMWTDSVVSVKPLASSFIMTNNLLVTLLVFASGITAGVYTLYLLGFNGVLMGVVGAACWLNGMSLSLWSFVAPHGVLELPAIFIAGGAALRIATAMLFPGYLSRRDSLVKNGGEAVRLFLGTIPLLIVAGLIEGFVSPLTNLSPSFKFTLATAIGSVFLVYLLFSIKPPRTAPGDSAEWA
jgi:uncharacterized membrane protein SpoIIM required for sporulation